MNINFFDDPDDASNDYLAVTIEEQRGKKDVELDEIAAIQRYFLASEDIRPSLVIYEYKLKEKKKIK